MLAVLQAMWSRETCVEKLIRDLQENVGKAEAPSADARRGEQFYEDAKWLNLSHKSRRELLAKISKLSRSSEIEDPRFVPHLYRSLALQESSGPKFASDVLDADVQNFVAFEKQNVAAMEHRAMEAAENGDYVGALQLCSEANDVLLSLGESSSPCSARIRSRTFLFLLQAEEAEKAVNFLWQHPSILKEASCPHDALRAEIERVLAADTLAKGPKLGLTRALRQLSPISQSGDAQQSATPTSTGLPLRGQYAQRLKGATLPEEVRHEAEETLARMESQTGQCRYLAEKWLDTVLNYPFGQVAPSAGSSNELVEKVRLAMKEKVTGHHAAKESILDFVHQRASSSSASASIIALQGPPGSGKSTLIDSLKEGLNLPYCAASLNGMANSGILFGVPRGIVGAGPGLFVREIIRQRCASPLFLLEEVDKVGGGPGGTEVISKLMALTDSLQNRHLVDDFLDGVRLSCPQSLIIFTLNDPEKIDPVLRSRMQIIRTEPLSAHDKTAIFDEHMLPKIAKMHGFNAETLKFRKGARNLLLQKHEHEGQLKQLSLELNTIIARASRGRSSGRFGTPVYVKRYADHLVVSNDPS